MNKWQNNCLTHIANSMKDMYILRVSGISSCEFPHKLTYLKAEESEDCLKLYLNGRESLFTACDSIAEYIIKNLFLPRILSYMRQNVVQEYADKAFFTAKELILKDKALLISVSATILNYAEKDMEIDIPSLSLFRMKNAFARAKKHADRVIAEYAEIEREDELCSLLGTFIDECEPLCREAEIIFMDDEIKIYCGNEKKLSVYSGVDGISTEETVLLALIELLPQRIIIAGDEHPAFQRLLLKVFHNRSVKL